jgi:hypothetical protein
MDLSNVTSENTRVATEATRTMKDLIGKKDETDWKMKLLEKKSAELAAALAVSTMKVIGDVWDAIAQQKEGLSYENAQLRQQLGTLDSRCICLEQKYKADQDLITRQTEVVDQQMREIDRLRNTERLSDAERQAYFAQRDELEYYKKFARKVKLSLEQTDLQEAILVEIRAFFSHPTTKL